MYVRRKKGRTPGTKKKRKKRTREDAVEPSTSADGKTNVVRTKHGFPSHASHRLEMHGEIGGETDHVGRKRTNGWMRRSSARCTCTWRRKRSKNGTEGTKEKNEGETKRDGTPKSSRRWNGGLEGTAETMGNAGKRTIGSTGTWEKSMPEADVIISNPSVAYLWPCVSYRRRGWRDASRTLRRSYVRRCRVGWLEHLLVYAESGWDATEPSTNERTLPLLRNVQFAALPSPETICHEGMAAEASRFCPEVGRGTVSISTNQGGSEDAILDLRRVGVCVQD